MSIYISLFFLFMKYVFTFTLLISAKMENRSDMKLFSNK